MQRKGENWLSSAIDKVCSYGSDSLYIVHPSTHLHLRASLSSSPLLPTTITKFTDRERERERGREKEREREKKKKFNFNTK